MLLQIGQRLNLGEVKSIFEIREERSFNFCYKTKWNEWSIVEEYLEVKSNAHIEGNNYESEAECCPIPGLRKA